MRFPIISTTYVCVQENIITAKKKLRAMALLGRLNGWKKSTPNWLSAGILHKAIYLVRLGSHLRFQFGRFLLLIWGCNIKQKQSITILRPFPAPQIFHVLPLTAAARSNHWADNYYWQKVGTFSLLIWQCAGPATQTGEKEVNFNQTMNFCHGLCSDGASARGGTIRERDVQNALRISLHFAIK